MDYILGLIFAWTLGAMGLPPNSAQPPEIVRKEVSQKFTDKCSKTGACAESLSYDFSTKKITIDTNMKYGSKPGPTAAVVHVFVIHIILQKTGSKLTPEQFELAFKYAEYLTGRSRTEFPLLKAT